MPRLTAADNDRARMDDEANYLYLIEGLGLVFQLCFHWIDLLECRDEETVFHASHDPHQQRQY